MSDVISAARCSKAAATVLGQLTRSAKDAALLAIADSLEHESSRIVAANSRDIHAAVAAGMSAGLIDRLTLDQARLSAIADAVRQVANLDDPVGQVVRGYRLPNGLWIRQIRVPLGVVAMIYEARPNVTVDAGALALKSGNAALLRGSSSAYETNKVLVAVMREALADTEVPADAIQLAPGINHESVKELLRARGLVDVIIPRGGAKLIRSVVENATVPVIETGVGNCHVYIDAQADLDMALAILLNSKVQRPSVCNAAETVLVHTAIAPKFWDLALPALTAAGVTVHGDEAVVAAAELAGVSVLPATDADWAAEYYSLDLAAAQVDDIDAALAHIRNWSSGHTDAIVSDSQSAIERFVAGVDSAAVMVNASTRFTDGEQFGFGAEIGISTQKLHARGPMGLQELTSTKYVVTGAGHVRE